MLYKRVAGRPAHRAPTPFCDVPAPFPTMEASSPLDTWTTAHDLSLVYIALAYGTDKDLADAELDVIVERLSRWNPPEAALEEGGQDVQEVIMEAAAIYLEEDADHEIAGSVETLGQTLAEEDRRHALEDALRIAEADGVLLSSEQNLLSALAEAWHLRTTGRQLIEESSVEVEAVDTAWSLLHDLGLVYVILAHSTDSALSDAELSAVLGRLQDWHEEVTEDDAREVLREVLTFYGEQPSEEALEASVRSIKEALPPAQRLVALDDLMTIADIEGDRSGNKREMIEGLADAWGVPVRMGAAPQDGEA